MSMMEIRNLGARGTRCEGRKEAEGVFGTEKSPFGGAGVFVFTRAFNGGSLVLDGAGLHHHVVLARQRCSVQHHRVGGLELQRGRGGSDGSIQRGSATAIDALRGRRGEGDGGGELDVIAGCHVLRDGKKAWFIFFIQYK